MDMIVYGATNSHSLLTSQEVLKLVPDERAMRVPPQGPGPALAGFHETTTTFKPVATPGNSNPFSPPQPIREPTHRLA
jgi:hypothetical protein